MSTLAIVLIVVGVVLALLIVGGYVVSRRRVDAPDFAAHVAAADQALEAARAEDRGWDRALIEAAARAALEQQRPGVAFSDLHLVLVDDRPGVVDDRAHVVAVGGGGQARVILTRRDDGHWACERIE